MVCDRLLSGLFIVVLILSTVLCLLPREVSILDARALRPVSSHRDSKATDPNPRLDASLLDFARGD